MNEHKNHRKRVRARFLNEGLESFEEHQVLEMLLFYGVSQIDTNEMAHRLIRKFGSLRGVFDADHSELMQVEGIGEACATLIKFAAAVSKRYAASDIKVGERFDTVEKVGKYLTWLYMGVNVEKVYLLVFNGKLEMTNCKLICEGSINSAAFTPRAIFETALLEKAEGIVLAHNHPTGLAIPSGNDIEYTTQLKYLCNQVGINLLEHIVVAGNSFTPILRKDRTNGEISLKSL